MRLDPQVKKWIERFVALARDDEAKEREEDLAESPDMADFYAERYRYTLLRTYAYVKAGRFIFRVHGVSGQIRPSSGRTYAYCGNIADFQNARDWKAGRVGNSRLCVPILQRNCVTCGGTRHVAKGLQGMQCSGCRGSDSRHVAAVRRLGGIPTMNGVPI